MKRAILAMIFLAACTDQSIIESAYPDGQKFSFRTMDGKRLSTYTCASAATQAETKARASKAHIYMDGRLTAAETAASAQTDARAASRALDAEVTDIVAQTEARYQCLFVDSRRA